VIWATPWAAAVALLAVLPLVAHLWSRHKPTRLPFPTLRFLRAVSPVSRRLRRVHDWPLFLLRLAIVAAIAAAAAGPTLVAPWRAHAWRNRLHRVVVIDASAADRASDVVQHARSGAASSSTLGPDDAVDLLDDAIAQATARASRTRTEIVIAWDGSRRVLSPGDLADTPANVGIVLAPGPPRSATATHAPGESMVIHALPADEDARQKVLRLLAGADRPGMAHPVEIVWPGAPAPEPTATPAPSTLRRVIDEIAADPRVRDAADRSTRHTRAPAVSQRLPGRVLARAADGAPLLRGWLERDRLVLVLDAAPTSPLALWSAVAAWESLAQPWLLASSDDAWSASELAAARREAVAPSEGPLPGGLDTVAAWAIALVLLAVEQWMRRTRAASLPGEHADAA